MELVHEICAVSCATCNHSSIKKQVTSCIQLYSQVSIIHDLEFWHTMLSTIFTQDNRGYYVQDLISDHFDEEEAVTAFCEGYTNYYDCHCNSKNKFKNHYRCSNNAQLRSLEITSYPTFLCVHIYFREVYTSADYYDRSLCAHFIQKEKGASCSSWSK